jgi:hypothetical protein
MLPRRFPPYVYGISFLLLLFPMLLVRALPQYAPLVSSVGAIVLLPILSAYFILVILPLIDHLRGVRLMPFNAKPVKMTFYSALRVVVFMAGIYLVFMDVLPAWRGAYDLYVTGNKPEVFTGLIDRQGSGLSFVPLVGGIQLRGYPDEFTWFYGHYLPYSETQIYTLTVLPDSNIVIDVTPFKDTPTGASSISI